MKILESVAISCLLHLLLIFQSHAAFGQLCPSSGTIFAQRSTLSHQNIATLFCTPGPGWGKVEFFRSDDRRILNYDFPTEMVGDCVHMVLELSPSSQLFSMEGTYVCRSFNNSNMRSSNNVTLLAYPEANPNSTNEMRVLRGQEATLVCPFSLGPLSRGSYSIRWTGTVNNVNRTFAEFNDALTMTIPNAAASHAGTYYCAVNTRWAGTVSRSITLDVYVALDIISYSQAKRAAALGDNTDNRFECKVKFWSALDRSVPMATWYINNEPESNVPGSVRFTTNPVELGDETATSTLIVTEGLVQDTGVYECRFTWRGYTVSHTFYSAIIDKPTLSILTSSEGHLYMNVTLHPSSLYQPWKLLVQFASTVPKTTIAPLVLNGSDSSPSLYMVPSTQLPPSSDYTVAVAVMVGDTVGPYSNDVTMVTAKASSNVWALITQNPLVSLVVVIIIIMIIMVLLILGICCYLVGHRHTCAKSHSNQNAAPKCVEGDGCDEQVEYYCWQAQFSEKHRDSCLPNDGITALQCQNQQSSSSSSSIPPPSPSPSHSENIPVGKNSCYIELGLRPENDYSTLKEVI